MTAEASTPDPRPETPDPPLADWFTPRRFAVFLLFAFVLAFPGIWMGTETFFRSDYGVMAYPAAHYLRESIWRGELPLWNPLSNCGAPFLAQWGTMCLYPGSLFFVALPMPWALGVFCLLHLWLGGLGARALAERWTGHRLAAAVAGTAFALNGASLACITWPNYCVALGWLPWIVLLTEQACREGGKKLVLAALAGTMQMLTGVPELVVMTWGLLGVLLIAEAWPSGGISNFHFSIGDLQLPLRFVAVVSLIAALSAAQLLPFFDLLAHSQRDASYRDARWPMPPWGWANFLVPLFRYGQTPQGFWIQVGQEFLSSYYLGLAPLALALVAVWKSRERRVWLLAGTTAFALVMALGDAGYLYTALKNLLPGGGIARFPVKFVLLAAFTVPMLAAFGLAWLMSGGSRREEAASGNAKCEMRNAESGGAPNSDSAISQVTTFAPNRSSALLAIGLALVAGVAVIIWLGQQHQLQYDRWPETRANALARLAWLAAALGAVTGAAGAWASPARERFLAAGALLVLLATDPLTHQPNQTPRIGSGVVQKLPEREAPGFYRLVPDDTRRFFISPARERTLLLSGEPSWVDDYWTKRLTFWSHLNLLDSVAKINGSSTLQLREQADIQRRLYPTSPDTAPSATALKSMLGVHIVTADQGEPLWKWQRESLPLVATGAQVEFMSAAESLEALFSARFDPRRVVFLPPEAAGSVPTNATNARVTTRRFAAHDILAEIETDAPTLVTVAQSFYHPWKAFVDGQPAKLWRANYAFQALAVPAGKHTVRLVYVDEKFRLGVGISLVGLTVCGFLWWRAGKMTKAQ